MNRFACASWSARPTSRVERRNSNNSSVKTNRSWLVRKGIMAHSIACRTPAPAGWGAVRSVTAGLAPAAVVYTNAFALPSAMHTLIQDFTTFLIATRTGFITSSV